MFATPTKRMTSAARTRPEFKESTRRSFQTVPDASARLWLPDPMTKRNCFCFRTAGSKMMQLLTVVCDVFCSAVFAAVRMRRERTRRPKVNWLNWERQNWKLLHFPQNAPFKESVFKPRGATLTDHRLEARLGKIRFLRSVHYFRFDVLHTVTSSAERCA